jgi:hypothetical protein
MQAYESLRRALNVLLAIIALVITWLSFRDGLRALRGDLAGMSLQLPDALRQRIRGVVREGARGASSSPRSLAV